MINYRIDVYLAIDGKWHFDLSPALGGMRIRFGSYDSEEEARVAANLKIQEFQEERLKERHEKVEKEEVQNLPKKENG